MTKMSIARGMSVYVRKITIVMSLFIYYDKQGGGTEPEAFYPQWRRINQPIDRPNTFHESLVKLIEGMFMHFK